MDNLKLIQAGMTIIYSKIMGALPKISVRVLIFFAA